jgi:hypothetical protein
MDQGRTNITEGTVPSSQLPSIGDIAPTRKGGESRGRHGAAGETAAPSKSDGWTSSGLSHPSRRLSGVHPRSRMDRMLRASCRFASLTPFESSTRGVWKNLQTAAMCACVYEIECVRESV